MVRTKVVIYVFIFMQTMYFSNAFASPRIENETIIEDKRCEVKAFHSGQTDKAKPSLTLNMTVKKHASGVAYALDFELFNNTNRNLVFRIPSAISEAFMTIIILNEEAFLQNGEDQKQILQNLKKYGLAGQAQISQNLKKYVIDGREEQKHDEFIIKAGDKKKWLLKMKDVLQTNDMVKKALVNDSQGRLMVFFSAKYFIDAEDCDKEYKRSELSYKQDEHFSLESYLLPN